MSSPPLPPIYVVVTFLLLIVILCAILGCNTTKEQFGNPGDNNIVLLKKSASYFAFVSTFFMSDSPSNVISPNCSIEDNKPTTCLPLTIFKFLPTFLDSLCSFQQPQPEYCSNFFIDNNTSPDPQFYDSPQVCQTVNGNLGQTKDQSIVRILNNNYTFMKRCIALNMTEVIALGGQTGTLQLKVTCSNNMTLFTLLRPCLIMFPGIGLFRLSLFNLTSPTILTNFSDTSSTFSFNMTPVTTTAYYNIVPPITTSTLTTTSFNNLLSRTTYPTIYYFNHLEAADYFTSTTANLTFNTLTLIFDQSFMKANSNGLTNVSLGSSSSVNVCNNISFKWIDNNFTVSGSSTVSSSGNFSYSAHSDFKTHLNNASSSIYHVVVSYTLDLLTITTFVKDLTIQGHHQKNCFTTMVQYAVTNPGSTTAIYNQYPFMAADLTGNSTICRQTEIPNMASIMKQLGYTI